MCVCVYIYIYIVPTFISVWASVLPPSSVSGPRLNSTGEAACGMGREWTLGSDRDGSEFHLCVLGAMAFLAGLLPWLKRHVCMLVHIVGAQCMEMVSFDSYHCEPWTYLAVTAASALDERPSLLVHSVLRQLIPLQGNSPWFSSQMTPHMEIWPCGSPPPNQWLSIA